MIPPQLHQHFAAETEKLLDKIPEWRADPARARAEMANLRAKLVHHYGFKPDDLQFIPLHQSVLVMRDAIAHREGQAKKEGDKASKSQAGSAGSGATPNPVRSPTPEEDAAHKTHLTALKTRMAKGKGSHEKAQALTEYLEAVPGPKVRIK